MNKTIIAAIVITALVVGGIVFWWQNATWSNEVNRLNNEIVDLRQQIAEGQPEAPQEENGDEPDPGTEPPDGTEVSQKPKAGWEQYFPNYDETTLEGKSVKEVRTLLGEPPVLFRNIAVNPEFSREIWVYRPHDEDPTGLYLYFKGGSLVNSRLDEFSGLDSLLGDTDFWYN